MGQVDLSAKSPARITNRGDGPVLAANTQHGGYELFTGSSSALNDSGEAPPPGVGAQQDGTFTVNLDQASLPEAVKLVLGETLKSNYVLDPRLQGSVTLVSNRPLNASELLSAFESALRLTGAALIDTGGVYKVVAMQEVIEGQMGRADFGSPPAAGYGVSAIPLRFISPGTLMGLMDSFVARSGTVRASKVGNLILIRGPAAERQELVDVVLSFDVDWMKSRTASIAILENGGVEDLAAKLEAVFADDSEMAGSNALKIVPVQRIGGIIVIANSREKVKRALSWIKRLDQESVDAPNYFVYAVQNGNATDLANILRATFGNADSTGPAAEVAPDKPTVDVATDKTSGSDPSLNGSATGDGTAQQQQAATDTMVGTTAQPPASPPATAGGSDTGTRITPNPANNTIVIRATAQEYRKILATLRRIDAPATQVLINTTIAEVTLNDQLRYGVQAYFSNNDVQGGYVGGRSSIADLTLKPNVPGMNFLLGSIANPRVVIDALSSITKVRVVSSPSVLVLENETATIKVGDQVPIQTQQLTTDGGNNVESYEYRDTGVILKVKPRVNANGMVTIELGQELSSAQPGQSASANPTISQRAISSKVSVNDQQTVLLGGLISGQESRSRETVPGALKVPLLGDLIGSTNNGAHRTELIVFITPKIIRNGDDAARESEALRDRMRNLSFN